MPQRPELRVTVDTNLLDESGIGLLSAAVKDLPIDIVIVTVSARESSRPSADFQEIMEGGVWGESDWGRAVWTAPIPETAFVGESSVSDAPVVASEQTVDLMESILEIIGGGSFPKRGDRDHLTAEERRQLRDAMILEAHTRNDRDIFVTKDTRGFIRNGRRPKLQRLCSTRIMTPDEFLAFCRHRANNL